MTDKQTPAILEERTAAGVQKSAAAGKPNPFQQQMKAPGSRPTGPTRAASIARAKTAFENFSLSKFAGKSLPYNYVPAKQHPAAVQKVVILKHIDKVKNQGTSNRAMTVALPKTTIDKLLPSYDAEAGTLNLDELMELIRKNMRGTDLKAKGNPILNRLSIQNKSQQIINNIKKGGAK